MKTEVLVIGAGPTGLSAAIVLAQSGVKVRIIDRNDARTDKSKALGVQAGTLICLRHAIGQNLVQKMLERGHPAREMDIHIDDRKEVRIDLSLIPDEYNFILILEQSETERILEEELARMGIKVERQHELIDFEQNADRCLATVRTSVQTEEIEAQYVFGCDGAHSMLREKLGISFYGLSYTGDFILADVKIRWKWPMGSMRTFVTERGAIACFPMRDDRYRLILIQPELENIRPTADISEEELESILKYISRDEIKITETFWRSRFRVHHRMANEFQKGRGFLLGDAAHIHSPVGGQGMNTGIQDAFNLAFKMKGVLRDGASPDVLKNYEKERMPVAKGVLRGTDFFTRLVIKKETLFIKFLRREVFPLFASSRFVQSMMTKAISEVNVAKEEIKQYSRPTD